MSHFGHIFFKLAPIQNFLKDCDKVNGNLRRHYIKQEKLKPNGRAFKVIFLAVNTIVSKETEEWPIVSTRASNVKSGPVETFILNIDGVQILVRYD